MLLEPNIEIAGQTFYNKNGAWIANDTIIGKNVTIFPGAVLGRPPLSILNEARKSHIKKFLPLTIGDDCIIGANVCLYKGITIGRACIFGETSNVREGVTIGDSCIIAMGVTINYDTKIGSRVKIMDNSHITGNAIIEDDVFISTHVTTTNDKSIGRDRILKHTKDRRFQRGPTIKRHVTIGQGACILPGIEIGENSIIGANSVVTKNIPARVLSMGVPARVKRKLNDNEIKPNV